MSFRTLIRRSTTTQSRAAVLAPGQPSDSVFVSPQSLTFPVAVLLIGGAWAAVRQLSADWGSHKWVPFGMSLIVGGVISIPAILDEVGANPGRKTFIWIRGIVVGLLNSLVLFGAVLGASKMQ